MSPREPGDIAASVRQRLLNRAKAENRPFQEILQYHAMERFLYRLCKSPHARDFILKGGLALRVWRSPEFRTTMDIDCLGQLQNDAVLVTETIRTIVHQEVEADGLLFDEDTIRTDRIIEGADYEGLRIRFRGRVGTALIHMQMDIGFGDEVFPGVEKGAMPSVLGFPEPQLLCYSRESIIAEKFDTMVKLGELNSRMKDFYDIWLLSRSFNFEGKTLAEAIRRTIAKRQSHLPHDVTAFSQEFAEEKQAQWSAFRYRLNNVEVPSEFSVVVFTVRDFLAPIVAHLHASERSPTQWVAPGPWCGE